jgi:hypothetical protein
MEAASRPSLEPLPDLPVEAPLDTPAAKAAAPAAPTADAGGTAPGKAEQTGITFLDPASLVLDTAEVPVISAPPAAAVPPVVGPATESELTLEDPVVDEMLTSPPPVVKSAPPPAPAAPAAPVIPDSARTEARVPIARTGSLSTAATKLAAASRRASEHSAPKPAAPAPVRPASPAPAAASGSPAQAQGLAGWTSARASATPSSPKPKASAPVPAAPAVPAPKPAPKAPSAAKPAAPERPVPAAAKPAAAAPAAANANAVPASPPMDKDFIARNQVVERYLSGRLPLKGATEFEQYCGKHPELLDEIGLPERVNAGLRLLEASGKPEPWQEPARPAWQKPQVTLGLAAVALVCGVAAAVLAGAGASKAHRIEQLQKQLAEQPLDPATSTREIRLLPSREGASNSPAIGIGGGGAQMADFKIDESRSPYHIFRVTIDRIDQGRVGVITNLVKDSNGHLRIALNSSALGPGNYQLTIEGIDWRGDPQPDSWITIGVQR